ncbi:Abi-alpha family protein [Saccharomonospora xinjiangensis]|uniref:Abi-alpha family protein n=1 Tax=Saccharomonospora xinjiangensis TaxID=75294 RepID=UPI003510C259
MAGWAARTGYQLAKLLPGDGNERVPHSAALPDHFPARRADSLRALMTELLTESADLNRQEATLRLYETVLRSLVPDEARLLATLAEGSPFPTLDVAERTLLGGAGGFVLRNASTVGRAAGVTLADHVPGYVTRLVAFGLADLGPEDGALSTHYEVLAADEVVLDAARAVRRPTFVRGTVRISGFGARLWAACDPAGEDAAR